jgi:hypothetical protein
VAVRESRRDNIKLAIAINVAHPNLVAPTETPCLAIDFQPSAFS